MIIVSTARASIQKSKLTKKQFTQRCRVVPVIHAVDIFTLLVESFPMRTGKGVEAGLATGLLDSKKMCLSVGVNPCVVLVYVRENTLNDIRALDLVGDHDCLAIRADSSCEVHTAKVREIRCRNMVIVSLRAYVSHQVNIIHCE